MHRRMLELLPQAEGHSCRVIAVFVDVRGFTSFAGDNESTDAAAFLRTMYLRILQEYFKDGVQFFKPTGDGLMIVLEHPDDSDAFVARMREVLHTAVRLVSEFPEIAAGDVMINTEVPKELGVGIARGSVTVLRSGDTTLDYTGRCLNLAARLMDLARPKGVVFSDKFAKTILDGDLANQFASYLPYLKGIEPAPVEVFVTKEWTDVPESVLRPPGKSIWTFDEQSNTATLGQLKDGIKRWAVPLSAHPPDDVEIVVHIQFDWATGGDEALWKATQFPATYSLDPNGPIALIEVEPLIKALDDQGVPDSTTLRFQAKYLA